MTGAGGVRCMDEEVVVERTDVEEDRLVIEEELREKG